MKLSDYDLRQIDKNKINRLSKTALKSLSISLLNDLKEAREQLNQNAKNSSIPSSSAAHWDKASESEDKGKDVESSNDIEALVKVIHSDKQAITKDSRPDEIYSLSLSDVTSETATTLAPPHDLPRKPGKQPGTQGYGNRTFKNLIKNSSMMFVLNLLTTVMGFFAIPITIKIIGIETYGYLVFIQSIASTIFTLTGLQYWQGLLVELPGRHLESSALKQIILKSLGYESIAMLIVMITAVILPIFQLSQIHNFSRIDLLLISISAVLPVLGTLSAFFRLVNKYNILMFTGLVTSAVKLILLYLTLNTDATLSNLILAYFIPELLRFVFLSGLIFISRPSLQGDLASVTIDYAKMFNVGKWATLQTIADLPVTHFDKIILGLALPGEQLGVYNILKKIYGVINMATGPFYITSIPEFATHINSKDIKGAFALWKKTTQILFPVVSLIALSCFFSMDLWMPFIYKGLSNFEPELVVVLITSVIAGTFVTTHSFYWALGKAKETTIVNIATNVIYLMLLYALSLQYGLMGSVLAFLAQVIIFITIMILLLKSQPRSAI